MSDCNPPVGPETGFHLEGYSKQCLSPITDWFRKRNRHIDAEGLANEVLQKLSAFVRTHEVEVFSEDRISALRQILCQQILGREIRRWKAQKRSGNSRVKTTLSLDDLILQLAESSLNGCQSCVDFNDWLQSVCEPLTKRERQIIEWKLESWTLSEIASKLSLSDSTIDRCIEKIKFVIVDRMEKESTRNKKQETRNRQQATGNPTELISKIHDARNGPFAFILLVQSSKQSAEACRGVPGIVVLIHDIELFAPSCARGKDVHPHSIVGKRANLGCNAEYALAC